MSAVTDAVPATAPQGTVVQSVRASLVIARRNVIRMTQIPNPVRSSQSGSISPRVRDRRPNAMKEQAK
ncbi:integral membrane transport protein [Streptomyces mirabilis]|uniref:integral membrane transport protein n=1 Tax=Streptomyces mirabilis TaxID=68239 RepID=UPI002254E561|nr:integral membrane transport protein [Streptomyces mirabilis]MCX4421798.1 integral membrane transport protein [Streptomyces mirabilis]